MKNFIIGFCLCFGLSMVANAAVLTCHSTYKVSGNPMNQDIKKLATATGATTLIVESTSSTSLLFTANTDFGTYSCTVTEAGDAGHNSVVGVSPTCTITAEPTRVLAYMKHAPSDNIGVFIGNCQ